MIPESHRDLVDCPPVAALSTVMPNGYPQTSVVWCDYDGTHVRVNTMRGFQKRNMRRDPLSRQARETRVICRIHPRRVTVDAIHAA